MTSKPPRRWLDDPAEQPLADLIHSFDDEPQPGAEARVWTRLTRFSARPIWPRVAFGVAAVAAMALVLWLPLSTPPQSIGEVAHADGALLVVRDGNQEPVRVGDQLAAGAHLQTSTGRSFVRLGKRGGVLLARSTNAVLEAHDRVQLQQGSLIAAVRPEPNASFHVVAGDFDVRVTGTTFRVERPDADNIRVTVWEGRVIVNGPSGSEEIVAEQSFSSSGALPTEIEQTDIELIRSLLTPSAGAPELAEPNDASQDSGPDDTTLDPVPDTRDGKAKGKRDERAYRAAVATKSPEKAIERFDAIAKRDGPRAEIAAYQAARLTMSLRPAEAIQRFEALLRRHPRGAFDAEARLSLIELRIKLGHLRTAEQEVVAFSKKHPRSERLPELKFLRAHIQRLFHHDCAAALPDYEAALASPRRRSDALFFKGDCLLQLGRDAEGRRVLEQYLETTPNGRHAKTARDKLGPP